jgi:hypothetical protein
MSYFSNKDDGVQEGVLDQEEEGFVDQDLLGLLEEGRQRTDLNTCEKNEAMRCCIMGNGNRFAQFRNSTINQIYYTVVKHQIAFR